MADVYKELLCSPHTAFKHSTFSKLMFKGAAAERYEKMKDKTVSLYDMFLSRVSVKCDLAPEEIAM